MNKRMLRNVGLAVQILGPISVVHYVNDRLISDVAAWILFIIGTGLLLSSGFFKKESANSCDDNG